MSQISPKLRKTTNGHAHWCPGCERMHVIPDTWTFNGDVNAPTFGPSVRISYNGSDADERRESGRRAPSACCHYILTGGVINFCGDCTHPLVGQPVPLPDLPPAYQGDNWSDG